MKTPEQHAAEIHRKCVEMDWADDQFCLITVKAIWGDAREAALREARNVARLHPMRPHADSDVDYRSGMKWMQGKIEDAILALIEKKEGEL